MKNLKRMCAIVFSLSLVLSICSCSANKVDEEEETATVHFDTNEEAYEAMTEAAKEGNYSEALKYYRSGAADANSSESLNWYYYAMSLDDYENDGCIGYPLDLLQNMLGDDFDEADAIISELQEIARYFDGAYYGGDGYYIYFSDGKIAVNAEVQITEATICTGELVYIDEVYYWADHVVNGDDNIMYVITITDTGFTLTAAEEFGSTETMYAGDYTYAQAEMPEVYY